MKDRAQIPIEDRTTAENPWPGLRSYDEEEQDFFYGRSGETLELFRLVRRDVLTVFFGISGIGKSSLLKAGLFPMLRGEGLLPIRLRLNLADPDPQFAADVIRAFEDDATAHALSIERGDAPVSNGDSPTLWEYFHRVRVWDHADRLTPVLVFDQFEEVFTLGGSAHAAPHISSFLTELADLVENQIPATVRRRIDQTRQPPAFRMDQTPYRIVLALREDYLGNLEGLVPLMPSLSKRNRFRLLPMTAKQALDAVLKPGAGVITEQVAKQVVAAVGFTRRAAGAMLIPFRQQGDRSEESEIEPFLLSLVCRELNNRRQEQKLSMISAELVQSSQGGVGQILSDFYDRCFSGMGPAVRVFVEDQLVGRTGYRQMIALADIQETPEVHQAIPTLVARRLLRIEEDRHGVARVELTHDVLTPIAVSHRNRRVVEEETARALQEQRAARRRRVVGMLTMLLVVAVGGMGVAIWQWSIATDALNLAQQRLDEVNKARELAQRRLESAEAAQQAAEAALKAYDTLKRASPADTPAAAQEVQQLQYRAQTELAVSNRIGAAANAPAPPVQSAQSAAPAPLTPRTYVQVRSQLEAERANQYLIPQLRKAGFTVPAPEVLATGPSLTEVRYFRPLEKEGAERIVSTLREAGIPNAQVKFVRGYENSQRIRQNHFEVWLAPGNIPETPSR
ncbi:MAG TPA: hypothetical protein VIH18_16305 [Candidatus Binatia bacterium]|jgi:hypothetical protein